MTRLTSYTAMMIAVILLMPAAHAQPGDWYFASSILYNDDDPDRAIADDVSGVGVQRRARLTEHLTLEGLLGYSDLEGYVRLVNPIQDQKHLDLQRQHPRLLRPGQKICAVRPRRCRLPGRRYGPRWQRQWPNGIDRRRISSALWRQNLSLRLEVRMRTFFDGQRALGGTNNLNDYDRLNRNPIQLRISWFEACPIPQSDKPTDTDGDGVLDMWDACANTPAGVDVTARGCEIKAIDRADDSDRDRVPDSQDKCPNTPTGVPVDLTGCSLDSDRDGVTTDRDRCPGTRIGAVVDQYGCESDDDHDGVVNSADRCPNTRSRAKVDENGCEIRDVISSARRELPVRIRPIAGWRRPVDSGNRHHS